MTKEFLLHKDKKENGNPSHIQVHLVLPDTQANASQSQKSLHFFCSEFVNNFIGLYLSIEKY
ncbi:MAG TPA: hypothetical protein PKL52_03300 [Tenuifilaceae bacterium]|jgi:hypothetical protein|nr:hypothetical protein [Tenuifilaceae bacterium]